MSKIQWTDSTWNPTVGCSRVSPGCGNCFAIRMAHRLGAMSRAKVDKGEDPGRLGYYDGLTTTTANGIDWTGEVRFVEDALTIPLRTKKPTVWFVNSMSDVFHAEVSDHQRDRIFEVMSQTPRHTYQILTKRPVQMSNYFKHRTPPRNAWLGVSVENQETMRRIAPLQSILWAAVRFLSVEPLLGEIQFPNLDGIHWAIVGGESDGGECHIEHIQSAVWQLQAKGVAPFVKQLGSKPRLDGRPVKLLGSPKGGDEADLSRFGLLIREYPTRTYIA